LHLQYCNQDGFLLTVCAKLRMERNTEEAIIILSLQFLFILYIIRRLLRSPVSDLQGTRNSHKIMSTGIIEPNIVSMRVSEAI